MDDIETLTTLAKECNYILDTEERILFIPCTHQDTLSNPIRVLIKKLCFNVQTEIV